jgi:hypothetical protein
VLKICKNLKKSWKNSRKVQLLYHKFIEIGKFLKEIKQILGKIREFFKKTAKK